MLFPFLHRIYYLRIIICLRKSKVTVERVSVYNVIEKLMEHGLHCLPRSYTNDVLISYRSSYDVILSSAFKVTSSV